jgi:Helix-turn-helix domain
MNSHHRTRSSQSNRKNKSLKNKVQEKYAARAKELLRCLRIASRASGSAARAFLGLQSFANPEGYCWPLVSTLRKETKLGRSRLFLALAELESLGIIDRRTLVSRVNGRNAPTLFRVGGKVTYLPKNAERYILANKRKPQSRTSKGCEVHKTRTSQPGGEVLVSRTGVVPVSRTGVVLKTRTQKVSMEVAAPIEAADAIAVGPIRAVDRGFSVLGSDADSHRHPPSPATATPDDDRAPKNKSPSSGKTKAGHGDSPETETQRLQKLKATALANIKAKYKSEFSDEYIRLVFDVAEEGAPNPIQSAKYYETAFRNSIVADRRGHRMTEVQKEVHVGEGPPVQSIGPRCAHCDENRFFHGQMLSNKKRFNRNWIEHEYSPVDEASGNVGESDIARPILR